MRTENRHCSSPFEWIRVQPLKCKMRNGSNPLSKIQLGHRHGLTSRPNWNAQLKQNGPFGNCPKLNSHAHGKVVLSGATHSLADQDYWWPAKGNTSLIQTSTLAHTGTDGLQPLPAGRSTDSRRRRTLRILFVHRDVATVERCLYELNRVQFRVNSDIALNFEELETRTRSKRYDLVVVEHPSVGPYGEQKMALLRRRQQGTPLILVSDTPQKEAAVDLTESDVHDCVEMDRIARLPMVVRRILDEKKLKRRTRPS